MACLHQMTARELDGMFPDDNACKAYLASRRWPDKVRCPRCGNPKVYRLRGFRWQCQACNSKGYQFSVLVGTIFENTKIPLKDWFRTIHLMLTKGGLTIVEVQRTIDLGSYRSAWYLCHRIRAALTNDGFRKLVGVVEVNEDREKTVSASTSTRPRNWGEDHAGIQFRAHRNHARRARTGNDKGAPCESNSCDKGPSR
jgi:transposase-like protein